MALNLIAPANKMSGYSEWLKSDSLDIVISIESTLIKTPDIF